MAGRLDDFDADAVRAFLLDHAEDVPGGGCPLEILHPDKTQPRLGFAYISRSRVREILSRSKRRAFDLGQTAVAAAEAPLRFVTFDGLDPEGNEEEGFYFTAKPASKFNFNGIAESALIGEVFLVLVSKNAEIYRAYWHDEDPENPGLPVDFDQGLKRIIL